MHRSVGLAVSLTLALAATGCSNDGGAPPQTSAGVAPGSAIAPAFERTSGAAPTVAAAEQKAKAPAEESAEDKPADEEPSESAADEAPLPDVTVKNIGMHIGGEKNTAKQKAPIREAVQKHYDAFKRCYAKSEQPKAATFGVDMRIPKEGGQAKISNPRNGFKDNEVNACLVAEFETIQFAANPRNLAQMVSFSLRFTKN